MYWMKKYFTALLAAAVLVGCQKSMSTDEISEKAHSGVVLIINYYYRICCGYGEGITHPARPLTARRQEPPKGETITLPPHSAIDTPAAGEFLS
jgi:hypothetical protein